VELEQLVCWVEQQLTSAGGASEELREAALVLAAASCKVRSGLFSVSCFVLREPLHADACPCGCLGWLSVTASELAYICEAGLVELEQLVCWVEQQLGSAGGASEELREAALVLAAASCKVSVQINGLQHQFVMQAHLHMLLQLLM
jgi:hypothetical protein